jgi:serine/threonine protein kinase
MSPAVAATLVLEDGRRAFVKAVGVAINPDTPDHFRNEAAILQHLPPAPYRPDVLATYDDGDWVALLLEDIAGGHPDLSDPHDRERVERAVLTQAAELTPYPPDVPAESTSVAMRKHLATIEGVTADERAALPPGVGAELPRLAALLAAALDRHRDESLCHRDIRYDNILLRSPDRQPVFVDWGVARRGRRWGDLAVFGLEWVHEPWFDRLLAGLDLSRDEADDVTGFLAGLAGYLLVAATRPPHPSLPRMPEFRRDLGLRCLAGVHRRST